MKLTESSPTLLGIFEREVGTTPRQMHGLEGWLMQNVLSSVRLKGQPEAAQHARRGRLRRPLIIYNSSNPRCKSSMRSSISSSPTDIRIVRSSLVSHPVRVVCSGCMLKPGE